MSRFMINLEQGADLVTFAFKDMLGGEIYVKKIPSMKVKDIAAAIAPNAKLKVVGIRPGEKLHEQMIGIEDAMHTYEYNDYYKILPSLNGVSKDPARIGSGVAVSEDFTYRSDTNDVWMSINDLREWMEKNVNRIGTF